MSSHHQFNFAWEHHGPAYNGQVEDLFGGPTQLPAGSSAFETASYQVPYQAEMADEFQLPSNAPMEGIEVGEPPTSSNDRAQPEARSSRQAKSEGLDWNTHKAAIKSLYVDNDKSLAETRKMMVEKYSFDAS